MKRPLRVFMAVTMPRFEHAGGMTEDSVSTLEPARRGLPTPFDSRLQELIGRGTAWPDGDRRQGSQSRGVEVEIASVNEGQ